MDWIKPFPMENVLVSSIVDLIKIDQFVITSVAYNTSMTHSPEGTAGNIVWRRPSSNVPRTWPLGLSVLSHWSEVFCSTASELADGCQGYQIPSAGRQIPSAGLSDTVCRSSTTM